MDFYEKYTTCFLLLVLSYGWVVNAYTETLENCPIKLEPIGCYGDAPNRAMPDHVLNARDSTHHGTDRHPGYYLSWKHYHGFLGQFLCDCAIRSFDRGYRVIGMQFYGECWSGARAHLDYKKYGNVPTCRTVPLRNKCKDGDKLCTGELFTNYVYRIAPTHCDTYYEPIGCYKDYNNRPRPLPNYILTERDYSHHTYEGNLIKWQEWNNYSPLMLCRCATKAKKMGYTTFSMQFFGECWSGEQGSIEYDRDGKSDRCIAQNFKSCPFNSYNCVGKDHVNRVYRLIEAPGTAKKWENPKESLTK